MRPSTNAPHANVVLDAVEKGMRRVSDRADATKTPLRKKIARPSKQ
jgi:hypothetical protein